MITSMRNLLILPLLAIALSIVCPSPALAQCSSCDINNTSCNTNCQNKPTEAERTECANTCYSTYSSCYASCNNSVFYHNWEVLGGWSNIERDSCYKACHRTGYTKCFDGQYYYGEGWTAEGQAVYNACIANGTSVTDCCMQHEYYCVDAQACWSL
jgi:hypothetical protein